MKLLVMLALLVSTNVFAATTTTEKVQLEIFTPYDNNVQVGQALQLLAIEKARPELFNVTPYYTADAKEKFVANTFWKTAYVAKYNRAQLADWLQCVYFDPETLTCGSLLNIDFKNLKSKESELRKDFAANTKKAVEYKNLKDTIFINGKRYENSLAYGQLLNVLNGYLPKEKQLANLGKYEVTKMYVIGNTTGVGARDFGFERDLQRWIPNLQMETLAPNSKEAKNILKASDSQGIPAYVFDRNSSKNTAVQKLTVAGKVKLKNSNYGVFELRSGVTEVKMGAKEVPNQLDLWVMSQCPFGVKAENAIINARAQNAIPASTKINLRYIVSESRDGKKTWQSLHGEPELTENIRQLAIQKTWPEKFWKYLEVRNLDYKSDDWKTAATTAGLNPTEVEAKMDLGRKLMAQDIKDGAALKVSGSPTYLWENRYVVNTPEEMKSTMGFNIHDYNNPVAKTPGDKRAPADKQQAQAPNAQCGS